MKQKRKTNIFKTLLGHTVFIFKVNYDIIKLLIKSDGVYVQIGKRTPKLHLPKKKEVKKDE